MLPKACSYNVFVIWVKTAAKTVGEHDIYIYNISSLLKSVWNKYATLGNCAASPPPPIFGPTNNHRRAGEYTMKSAQNSSPISLIAYTVPIRSHLPGSYSIFVWQNKQLKSSNEFFKIIIIRCRCLFNICRWNIRWITTFSIWSGENSKPRRTTAFLHPDQLKRSSLTFRRRRSTMHSSSSPKEETCTHTKVCPQSMTQLENNHNCIKQVSSLANIRMIKYGPVPHWVVHISIVYHYRSLQYAG